MNYLVDLHLFLRRDLERQLSQKELINHLRPKVEQLHLLTTKRLIKSTAHIEVLLIESLSPILRATDLLEMKICDINHIFH